MDEVQVNIDPEVEAYPVLVIREAEEGNGGSYAVPRGLFDALEAAQDTVAAIETAIMEHVAQAHPDATRVVEWVQSRKDDAILTEVRDAWEAAHPDGPPWHLVPVRQRDELLRAAGWGEEWAATR